MSDELVLLTHSMSRGRTARWMLEEVGAPYRTELMEYGPAMRTPEFLALNPMGKIPVLRHGAVVVTECAAICAYLADAFPAAGLAPSPADPARGTWYRWLFFGAGPLEAAVVDKALGVVVPTERRTMVGYGDLATVTATLEALLASGTWILGERFSAADVYLGSQIGFGLMFGSLEPRPALEAYVQRIKARPAWQRAAAMDDALMPPPKPD